MSATVIAMTEAISDGQELLGYYQAGTLSTNELEAARCGLNIANFGAQFLIKDKPPVMGAKINANQAKVLQDLLAEIEKPRSLLSVVVLAAIAAVTPVIKAWLAAHGY